MNTEDLPATPADADWAEAKRRRSSGGQVVFAGYEVRDGVLQPLERGDHAICRSYVPMASPTVVGEFLRLTVGDEAALVAFARRWGLLGYDDLCAAFIGN